VALVGTSRGAAADLPLPPAVEEATASLPKQSAEHALLNRASLWFSYQSCGRKPELSGVALAACKPDVLVPCSPRAADILQDLLRDKSRELIAEWLQLAA